MSDDTEADGRTLTFETVDRKAVGRVARYVQLNDIRAVHTVAAMTPRYGMEEELPGDWVEHVVIGYDALYVPRETANESQFRVTTFHFAHFDHSWADRDPEEVEGPPEDRPVDVAIEVRYLLDYELSDPKAVSEYDLEHFGFFNGTFNAWPYWREHAHSLSSRMGLTPALVVPVFRVPSVEGDVQTPAPEIEIIDGDESDT